MKRILLFMVYIFICAFIMVEGFQTGNVSDIILNYGFHAADFAPQYIIYMSFWYMPLFLFHILFGVYIYRHFCSANVYFFSRRNHRVRWFLKEAVKLYMYTLVYLIAMLLFSIGIEAILGKLAFDVIPIALAGYYLVIHSLFLFVTTLAVNLLAILFSSNVAFVAIEGICILGMGLYTFQGEYPGVSYILEHPWIIKLNPISHLVLDIHNSKIDSLDRMIHTININFDLNISVLYYLTASIIVVLLGCILIKKYDFLTEQRTEGE